MGIRLMQEQWLLYLGTIIEVEFWDRKPKQDTRTSKRFMWGEYAEENKKAHYM